MKKKQIRNKHSSLQKKDTDSSLESDDSRPKSNKKLIVWIYFIILINIVHSIYTRVVQILLVINPLYEPSNFETWFFIQLLLSNIKDLMMGWTFSYIAYYITIKFSKHRGS